jgi:hypothetical protein
MPLRQYHYDGRIDTSTTGTMMASRAIEMAAPRVI